eukprot:jgi/Mesvir1/2869/Mv13952-RA.1
MMAPMKKRKRKHAQDNPASATRGDGAARDADPPVLDGMQDAPGYTGTDTANDLMLPAKAKKAKGAAEPESAPAKKLSKSEQRKLRKVQEEKEKKAMRGQMLEQLAKYRVNDEVLELLRPSSRIGQKETMKERLRHGLRLERAGLPIPTDIPLFKGKGGSDERGGAGGSIMSDDAGGDAEDDSEGGEGSGDQDVDCTDTVGKGKGGDASVRYTAASVGLASLHKQAARGIGPGGRGEKPSMAPKGPSSGVVRPAVSQGQAAVDRANPSPVTAGRLAVGSGVSHDGEGGRGWAAGDAVPGASLNREVAATLMDETDTAGDEEDEVGDGAEEEGSEGAKEGVEEDEAAARKRRLREKMQRKKQKKKEKKEKKENQARAVAAQATAAAVGGQQGPKGAAQELSSKPVAAVAGSNGTSASSSGCGGGGSGGGVGGGGNWGGVAKEGTRVVEVVHVKRRPDVEAGRSSLPIIGMEQEIMEAVEENDVVLVCGETGCGKTTQVPQFLYEAGYGQAAPGSLRRGMIGVTQPRRVAVLATARRVAHELGSALGQEVGFQVRYDVQLARGAKVKFMTDGILLREVQSDFLLRKYSVIIIDEAHERSINTDILIGLLSRIIPLRKAMAQTSAASATSAPGDDAITPLKLIIMSATLRVEDFTANPRLFRHVASAAALARQDCDEDEDELHATPMRVVEERAAIAAAERAREGLAPDPAVMVPPPVIKVPARQYPVTVHFNRRTELLDYEGAAFSKVKAIHSKLPPGGILVFLTGQREVESMCKRLRQAFPPPKVKRRGYRDQKHGAAGGTAKGAGGAAASCVRGAEGKGMSQDGGERASHPLAGRSGQGANDDVAKGMGKRGKCGAVGRDGGRDGNGVRSRPEDGVANDSVADDSGLSASVLEAVDGPRGRGEGGAEPGGYDEMEAAGRGVFDVDGGDDYEESDEDGGDSSAGDDSSTADESGSASDSSGDQGSDGVDGRAGGRGSRAHESGYGQHAAARHRASSDDEMGGADGEEATDEQGPGKEGAKAAAAGGVNGADDKADGDGSGGQKRDGADEGPGYLHVLPLYAMLSAAQQVRVFAPPPPGSRLVVVATNVAETSLTIPGIKYVVDCGRAKVREYDPHSGGSKFVVRWISKASADQRAGRAGRTGPGHCYRLYSSALFNDTFALHAEPEILNTPIEGVVLQMKAMGINKVINFPFPTPPNRADLSLSEKALVALGALAHGTRSVTPLGAAMAKFPLNPRHSRMLLSAAVALTRPLALLPAEARGTDARAGAEAARRRAAVMDEVEQGLFGMLLLASVLSAESPFQRPDDTSEGGNDAGGVDKASKGRNARDASKGAEEGGDGEGQHGADGSCIGQGKGEDDQARRRQHRKKVRAAQARFVVHESDALSATRALWEYVGVVTTAEAEAAAGGAVNVVAARGGTRGHAGALLLPASASSKASPSSRSVAAAGVAAAEAFCSSHYLHARIMREMSQMACQLARLLLMHWELLTRLAPDELPEARLMMAGGVTAASGKASPAGSGTALVPPLPEELSARLSRLSKGKSRLGSGREALGTTGVGGQKSHPAGVAAGGGAHVPPFPSPSQLAVLRRSICAGWVDRVARRVKASDNMVARPQGDSPVATTAAALASGSAAAKALSSRDSQSGGPLGPQAGEARPDNRPHYTLSLEGVSVSVRLHPSSVLSRRAPPDMVVYSELVTMAEQERSFLQGVTEVDPLWLPVLAAPLCTLSAPLDDPPPWYSKAHDAIMCWVNPAFGPHLWELPRFATPLVDDARWAVRVFAATLMDGFVLEPLKALRGHLAANPALITRAGAAGAAQTRVGELLHALGRRQVTSRKALAACWAEDRTYLYREMALWLQAGESSLLADVWPSLLSAAMSG